MGAKRRIKKYPGKTLDLGECRHIKRFFKLHVSRLDRIIADDGDKGRNKRFAQNVWNGSAIEAAKRVKTDPRVKKLQDKMLERGRGQREESSEDSSQRRARLRLQRMEVSDRSHASHPSDSGTGTV